MVCPTMSCKETDVGFGGRDVSGTLSAEPLEDVIVRI